MLSWKARNTQTGVGIGHIICNETAKLVDINVLSLIVRTNIQLWGNAGLVCGERHSG